MVPSNNLILVCDSPAEQLCLACGLCCNGVLFKDVELQPGDDAIGLRKQGLPVSRPRSPVGVLRFPQPCAALGPDCRCHIYPDRPTRCQQFECALLKAVLDKRIQLPVALTTIRTTLQRSENGSRLW